MSLYFRLHALDLTTGADKVTPAVIQGNAPGTSSDAVNGIVTFNAIAAISAARLAVAERQLSTSGSVRIRTLTPYHGWLFAYSASPLCSRPVCSASLPPEERAGYGREALRRPPIRAATSTSETGNGLMNVNTAGHDYGDSIVKVGMTPSRPRNTRLLLACHAGCRPEQRLGPGQQRPRAHPRHLAGTCRREGRRDARVQHVQPGPVS